MKSLLKKCLFGLTVFLMVAGISACSNGAGGKTPAEVSKDSYSFEITLPGAAARAVNYYGQNDAAKYVVTVSKASVQVAQKEGLPGATVKFTVAEEGTYNVNVKAYNSENVLIGEGDSPITVSVEPYDEKIKVKIEPKVKDFEIDVDVEWGDGEQVAADFVLIPAGTFLMGSKLGDYYTKTVHSVTISKAFYMCDHEVTQAEYEAVMGEGSNPSYFKTGAAEGEVQEKRPVEYVSWYMAIVYCNKRSIKEGLTPCYTISGKTDPAEWGTIPTSSDETWNKVECNWTANGYRLPTEAEWEYAARAGDTTVDAFTWSGTNTESSLRNYAWYSSNAGSKTHEVKKMSDGANAFGLYDMSGNVWEWCWDLVSASYAYSSNAVTDPRGDVSGSNRIRRGGSYNDDVGSCTVSYRSYNNPSNRLSFFGFRVCRNAN